MENINDEILDPIEKPKHHMNFSLEKLFDYHDRKFNEEKRSNI